MTSTARDTSVGRHRSRRWARAGLSALAAAGVVVTAGCSASGTSATAPPSAAVGHHGKHRPGIAGQISAMNGATWTVTTAVTATRVVAARGRAGGAGQPGGPGDPSAPAPAQSGTSTG